MKYPKLLEIQLTGSCNLKCSYCGNSEKFLNDSSANIENIIRAIKELRPERILFTGGEVYLEWEALIKILNELRNQGVSYQYTLSSNLTIVTTEGLDLLIDTYGFDTFHSSFNDLNDEMSYAVRKNTPRGRLNLINNLKHLCQRGVNVRVETMLIAGTIEYLKEINELLFAIGVKNHKLEFLIPVGQTQDEIIIDYKTVLDKVLEFYKSKENDSKIIPCCFPIPPCEHPHKLFNLNEPDIEFNKCVDGIESCYLMSSGKLLPCFIFPEEAVNPAGKTYLEQWQEGSAFAWFRTGHEICKNCEVSSYNVNALHGICSNGCSSYNYIRTDSFA